MASGCDWFYENVAKATQIVKRHPYRTGGAVAGFAGADYLMHRKKARKPLLGPLPFGYQTGTSSGSGGSGASAGMPMRY